MPGSMLGRAVHRYITRDYDCSSSCSSGSISCSSSSSSPVCVDVYVSDWLEVTDHQGMSAQRLSTHCTFCSVVVVVVVVVVVPFVLTFTSLTGWKLLTTKAGQNHVSVLTVHSVV